MIAMSHSANYQAHPRNRSQQMTRGLKVALLALGASIVLAGCAEDFPMIVEPQEHDYRQKHPLTVKTGTAVTWISFNGKSAVLGLSEIAKLGRYFASYIAAGQSTITITVGKEGVLKGVVDERIQALRTVALQEGLKARELRFEIADTVSAPDGPVAAKLGYLRYIAELPPCPDWSKDSVFSSTNTNHSNFGCATQSNLGAMIVDPADLVRMRPMAPSDAEIGDNAIRVLRVPAAPATTGTATGTGTGTGTTN